jgi:hypothetical protein
MPFIARRTIIKLIILFIRGFKPNILKSKRIRVILKLKGI